MKYFSITSVMSKSAITPSFIGLIATMSPGVRPSMSLASRPTAYTLLVFLSIATIEGSLTTIPRPLAKTKVFAVPRSMARSLEKKPKIDRRFIPLLDRNLNAVPGELLRAIHRRVGLADQPFGGQRMLRTVGHADADGESDPEILAREHVVHDSPANAFGDQQRARKRRLRQDDDELVAAVPAGNVGLAQDRAEHLPHLGERLASHQMPERVVDVLEPVDVDEKDRDPLVVTETALHFVVEELRQVSVVVELGEIVRDGEVV